MRAALPIAAVAAALVLAGCAGAPEHPRAFMIEEDSHPHEVAPGGAARFHVAAAPAAARVDVKCSLAGPASAARITFHGIRPSGRTADDPVIAVGAREIFIDIEGLTEPGHERPHFAIVNDGAAGLLWHQCYNN